MSLCCKCYTRECWLENFYCFECYREITNTSNHIPRKLVNKEYEYTRQENMIDISSEKKIKSKKILGEIKKSECKRYRLILFAGRARDAFDTKKVKNRIIVLNSPKKKNVKLSIFIDEENEVAYFPKDVYSNYVCIVSKYFK